MSGFDLSALATALGAYHRQHSANVLAKKIYNPNNAGPEDPITFLQTLSRSFIKDEEGFARLELNLQARESDATVAVQSDDAVVVTGDTRKLRSVESIFNFAPDALNATFMDHVQERRHMMGEELALEDLQFVPWFLDYMLQQWMDNLTTISMITGDYTPGFTYASASNGWGAALDGILTIIADKVLSTDITNVVTTGAINATNAYASLEAMGKAIPQHVRYQEFFLYASETITDHYNDDRAKTFLGENALLHPKYKQYRLRNRNRVTIVPVPEFGNSGRVILTTKGNIRWNQDWRKKGPEMRFTPINTKEIQVLIKHGTGLSLDRYDEVIVNDQA